MKVFFKDELIVIKGKVEKRYMARKRYNHTSKPASNTKRKR